MTAYEDRLVALQALAREALDAVADIGGREAMPAGPAIDRLERVLGFAVAVLDAAEGDLLTEPTQTTLTTQLSQFNRWGDDHQRRAQEIAGHAEPWADALLTELASLPLARDQQFAQRASAGAANYQRSIRHRLQQLDTLFDGEQERVAAIQAELTALVDEVKAEAAKTLDEVRTEAQTGQANVSDQLDQLSATFETRLAEIERTIATERTAIDRAKTSQAETFRTAQNERDAEFKTTLAAVEERLESLLDRSKTTVETAVAEIERMEHESAALVGAIGLAGTAERYGEEAKQQRRTADRWRTITVVLAVIAAVVAVVVAVTLGHNPQWQEFVGKFAASLLVGGAAAYTARQSARHRQREERARNLQLELTAFSPFIEPLSAEQQQAERIVMTRKTFGKANAELSDEEELGPHPLSLIRRSGERDAE